MAQSAVRKKLAKSWSEMKQRCTNKNHNRQQIELLHTKMLVKAL